MRLRMMLVFQVGAVFFGCSALRAGGKSEIPIVEQVAVRWSSIRYGKSAVLQNPEVSSADPETSEGLSLTCEVDIRDPNVVLGTCEVGKITELVDGKSRKLDIASSAAPQRQVYMTTRYRPRFTQPPQVPRWKARLRSVLKLPGPAPFRPQLVMQLQPSRLELRLDQAVLDQDATSIRRLEGHFSVLVAESLTYVDVPFEPNSTWVELVPGVEIQVREAYCSGTELRLEVETRPQAGLLRQSLGPGAALPERLVINRLLLGADGKPRKPGPMFPFLPIHPGGRSSMRGRNLSAVTIRYVIAVNPTHQEIPFVLKDIPLPQPEP